MARAVFLAARRQRFGELGHSGFQIRTGRLELGQHTTLTSVASSRGPSGRLSCDLSHRRAKIVGSRGVPPDTLLAAGRAACHQPWALRRRASAEVFGLSRFGRHGRGWVCVSSAYSTRGFASTPSQRRAGRLATAAASKLWVKSERSIFLRTLGCADVTWPRQSAPTTRTKAMP